MKKVFYLLIVYSMPYGMNAYTPQQRPFYADDKELERQLIAHYKNPRASSLILLFQQSEKLSQPKKEIVAELKKENE